MTTSPRVKNPVDDKGLSQCFHKVSTTIYVSLAPVYTQNPTAGIKSQHLDPLLMTYFPSVDGVVLSYSNLRLLGKDEDLSVQAGETVMAKVMYDSPFAYLWIAVDFLVWRPQAGDKVEGWVNLQSPSHIGLLIHDTFNASIKRDAIPSDWYFEPLQADEVLVERFGRTFVDYYCHIKQAEIARFNLEVSEWEHREYFDMY